MKTEKQVCYHCGSSSSTFVEHDHKKFCCEGCAIVYDILKENKLVNYYEIDNNPGIRTEAKEPVDSYDYLDNEQIKNSLLDFHDGKTTKVTLYIPAIHCSSCIWLLENLHRLHKGIAHSYVNFTAKKIYVTFNEELISLRQLVLLLESLHYKPLVQRKKIVQNKKGSKKKILIKMGIAGFAFGNIMLLSFPSYLNQAAGIPDRMIHYFSYISLILSLPVIIYCASDYFLSSAKSLRRKMVSIDIPVALGISVIFLRSCYEIITGTGPGYLDSMTGLVFFLLIGRWFQDRTYQALNFENDYSSYFPMGILKIDGGKEFIAPILDLRGGDIIRVRNQEIIPADASLESEFAAIDYSFITGESVPVQKKKGDRIFAGGRLIGGTVQLKVLKEVEASYLAQLWKEKGGTPEETTIISAVLDKVSKYFTIIILLIAAGTGIFWLIADPAKSLLAVTSVLIVACPCALALSVPFTFGHVRRIFGKNQFYLRHSSVIENLSATDTIVFDKTGTLTDTRRQEATDFTGEADPETMSAIKSLAGNSLHPLSRAINSAFEKYADTEVTEFEEIAGAGISGYVSGRKYKIGSAQFVGRNAETASQDSAVFVAVEDSLIGRISIKNHYRKGWDKLLSELASKYEVHLLSGDNDMERPVINDIIKDPSCLHFNQTPEDKLRYIRNLRTLGKKILMVGDGLNDAAALKESHTGISVADDIYQFSPASDAIIYSGQLAFLWKYLRFSITARKIVFFSFVLSSLYNLVGISMASAGLLSPLIAAILMPLSSISVVIFSTVAINLMAQKQKLS